MEIDHEGSPWFAVVFKPGSDPLFPKQAQRIKSPLDMLSALVCRRS